MTTQAPQQIDRAEDVAALQKALARAEGGHRWIGRVVLLLALVGAAGGAFQYRRLHPPPKPTKYILDEVSVGDVVETIRSTGTVQPVTQVQVGAQVSGRILKRYCDFNSVVKKGDLLAELDPLLFQANVAADQARVANAVANDDAQRVQINVTKAQYDRVIALKAQGLANEADIVTSKGNYESAVANKKGTEAQVLLSRASLKNSTTSLAYAKIYAPIDGVVISRSIDEGQTVAASFQAPVLFTIAQDLRQMIVLADVDEADLGRLSRAKSPEIEVRVEAFPGESFPAKLQEIRFNSTTTQGVVTYPAVIDVANPDLKLRPGMTATVIIKTATVKEVLRVPNASLRYHPAPLVGADGKVAAVIPEAPLPKGKGRVYLGFGTTLDDAPKPRVVSIGLTDGRFTELIVETTEGEPVSKGLRLVIDETDEGTEQKKQRGPF
ncbi:MAG: efflux RND transporter periplasmic adaptor subunit [Polyangiales bacterium]